MAARFTIQAVGYLIIEDNNALKNIDGLSSLTAVTIDAIYSIKIQRNAALLNLDGLSAIQEVQNLIIEDNPSLADCRQLAPLIDPIDDFCVTCLMPFTVICYQNNGSQAALWGSILRPQESAF